MFGALKRRLGRGIAAYLSQPIHDYQPFCTYDVPVLESHLRPADILLVDGNTRISTAIKYLTQSTWSHSAFYAGDAVKRFTEDGEACPLIEAELLLGVVASPLSKYRELNTRICRPVGLSDADRDELVSRMVGSIGLDYDLQNVVDLARYLCPVLPMPARLRRRLIAFGSGEPTRAICSTLIAEMFQSIHYPILPRIEKKTVLAKYHYSVREILHIKHHSLFTPRDFDVSPYFRVLKPTVESGFDYRAVRFDHSEAGAESAAADAR
ncbi:MAG: lipo-like protein [Gammaproteobacteria bacterium]|nr:lipo-like protein [Gammaproteobacteria bacterium]MDA7970871.1 lipo-like protein [Gammaproteobacteria bacterium]MDA7971701.1 lipo-like protein [Gammaproteobacteria bacterium]MDA7996100.1 lipo-like protein [Gammaproteobacteria bacterium]CAJ2376515.1 MAG: Lipo-like protein [Arenicellales bacterium IbO2]